MIFFICFQLEVLDIGKNPLDEGESSVLKLLNCLPQLKTCRAHDSDLDLGLLQEMRPDVDWELRSSLQ